MRSKDMESNDTEVVMRQRTRDQQREDESLEPPGRTPAEAPWGTARKVAFRFAFSYLFLYIFPFPFALIWEPGRYEGTLWYPIVPWFGEHILRLRSPIDVAARLGADTTYDYARVLCIAFIAALATVVWSVLDRKRTNYSKL